MDKIKNIDGKTVCFVDKNKKTVEIIKKGFKMKSTLKVGLE